MKTLWSKKALIALTVTNLATIATSVAYIAKEKGIFSHRLPYEALGAAPHRHGVVEPVYFKNADALQTCYESFLRRAPAHDEGSVLVNMRVTSAGQVDSLKMVQTDFDEPIFTQCVLEKIKATRLPASTDKEGVMIAHRFNFKRKTVNRADFGD